VFVASTKREQTYDVATIEQQKNIISEQPHVFAAAPYAQLLLIAGARDIDINTCHTADIAADLKRRHIPNHSKAA
jgi:hypothetical protein